MPQNCMSLEASAPQAAVDPSAEAVSPAGFGRAKEAALKTESDDALLERIAGNDQEAFRVLVERHIDRAYGLALRILNNRADAEDIVQDTLLKIWLHRGRWESSSAKFSTWLYWDVTNRCMDVAHRQPRSEDLEQVPEVADAKPLPSAAMRNTSSAQCWERR